MHLAARQDRVPPRSLGRYDFAGDEFRPPSLGRPPASHQVRTSVVAVADPYTKGKRILVAVNRRTDLLEDERAHGLISEAGYQAGRHAQAIFELAKGPGTSNWRGGDRIDASTASDLAVAHGVDNARKIHAYTIWIRSQLGKRGAALLVSVLRERRTYAEIATAELKLGERGRRYIAARFRDDLECLAEAQSAHGRQLARIR